MTQLINTPAHRAARNAASIALADTGPGVASICLYTAQGGDLLALRRAAEDWVAARPERAARARPALDRLDRAIYGGAPVPPNFARSLRG